MSKRIYGLLGLVWSVIASSCSGEPAYTIKGELEGLKEDSKLYIISLEQQRSRALLDSTTHVNGVFTLNGELKPLKMYYLNVDLSQTAFPIFLNEDGTITVSGNVEDRNSVSIKGTTQNDYYEDFKKKTADYNARIQGIGSDLRKAQAEKNDIQVTSLREEYQELIEDVQTFEVFYIGENPKSYISLLLLANRFSANQMDVSKALDLFNQLDPNIAQTEEGQQFKKALDAKLATKVGVIAPSFEGPAPDGSIIRLNENMGSKATIIDFWAGWCRPCRAQNPHLVSIYNQYKDQGLQIIGVSLDRDREEWLKAIQDDGLQWPQLSHLNYFDGPIATAYSIQAIPSSIIIDDKGIIVAKDVRGPELDSVLAGIFN